MEFTLDMGSWNSVFAVPHELVNNHIKLCSQNELKFILWVFANPMEKISAEKIFESTGISTDLFEDCLEYWIQVGLLKKENTSVSKAEKTTTTKDVIKTEKPRSLKMLRPDSIHIANRINESKTLANLFSEAQSILGKTLSPTMSAILLNAFDDYLLPVEVILMLLSYCASTERTSTHYIENMVKNWYESAVDSLEKAEEKIIELSEKNRAWKEFSAILGISSRSPVKTEEKLSYQAICEMKFSKELIRLCYEECVKATGKYQIRYMEKVFNSWYEKGFKTPFDVVSAKEENKKKDETKRETSYDLSDF
ncbi:MAG: DnaD domain protein [Clostridia bacterium]